MKRIICLLLVLSCIFFGCILTGCNKDEVSNQKTTEAPTEGEKSSSADLNAFINSSIEGDNPLYGAWETEDINYLYFIFRNDGLAEMVMGTWGTFTTLTIDADKKTLSADFMLGLTGEYTYELSEDKNTLTLTAEDKETVLTRKDSIDMIPKAKKTSDLDEKLYGWWKSEEGLIFYFDKEGIMYSNMIASETFYTYSAFNGTITAYYNMGDGEDIEYTVNYSTGDGIINIDGNNYSPYEPM